MRWIPPGRFSNLILRDIIGSSAGVIRHHFENTSKHNSNLSLSQLQFVLSENALLNNKTVQIMFPATRYHWTLYVDPITSLILTLLILMTTLKVLKVPIMILLQTVPKNINLKQLSNELIQLCRDSYEVRRYFILPWPVLTFKWLLFKAEVNIHNLHVWTLTGNKVVGTVHIKLINESNQSVQIEKFNKVKFIYIWLNLLRAPSI